jgi:hypothetical protein
MFPPTRATSEYPWILSATARGLIELKDPMLDFTRGAISFHPSAFILAVHASAARVQRFVVRPGLSDPTYLI